jgi:hypothetical protein
LLRWPNLWTTEAVKVKIHEVQVTDSAAGTSSQASPKRRFKNIQRQWNMFGKDLSF